MQIDSYCCKASPGQRQSTIGTQYQLYVCFWGNGHSVHPINAELKEVKTHRCRKLARNWEPTTRKRNLVYQPSCCVLVGRSGNRSQGGFFPPKNTSCRESTDTKRKIPQFLSDQNMMLELAPLLHQTKDGNNVFFNVMHRATWRFDSQVEIMSGKGDEIYIYIYQTTWKQIYGKMFCTFFLLLVASNWMTIFNQNYVHPSIEILLYFVTKKTLMSIVIKFASNVVSILFDKRYCNCWCY